MPPTSPALAALMRKLREVWNEKDETRQEYLLRELEAMIHRYQQEMHDGR
jgi:hypothetical protein